MKQGLPFLFTTSMECTTRHLAMVPFTLMRSSPPPPPAFGTSHWHGPWVWMSVPDLSTLRWDASLGRAQLTGSSGGRDDADLTPYRKSPPKSITWEHIHFRSFSFPATASFVLLLYSLFFPQELFPALPWFFLNDFYYIIAVSRLDVSGPKQTCAAKPEHRTCRRRQAGGCWLPSPAHSSRQSCGWIPAASPSQTAAAKIGKKNTTRTVLMRHTQMDEYFIVIPGKAFKRTHKTTIMRSCLGTQIKNISNLTYKGKDFLNENIVSINHKIAWTKTAKRCT